MSVRPALELKKYSRFMWMTADNSWSIERRQMKKGPDKFVVRKLTGKGGDGDYLPSMEDAVRELERKSRKRIRITEDRIDRSRLEELAAKEEPVEEGIPARFSRHLDDLNSAIRVFEDEIQNGDRASADRACVDMANAVQALRRALPRGVPVK